MNGHVKKQAVIYCRVSSIKQTVVGTGLQSQETHCREFAQARNLDVIGVFTDDVSGKLVERPGMKALLTFIRARRVQGTVVIIDDLTRLARDMKAHLELRAALSKVGATLMSPSHEFGDSSESQLVEHLLASTSQFQRQKNAEQTKNRMRSRVVGGYWVFPAPIGYRYERVAGHGKMLKRDEPVASVIQEALEGYASGRFEKQTDVLRFLQANPLYGQRRAPTIRSQRVHDILSSCVYSGCVEAPNWDVSRRAGHHEGLISLQTYQRIQDRLNGAVYGPRRKNLSADFPLRGFVVCADCDTPLRSGWSKGRDRHHPYYLCQTRGCASYGKSIRRETIEGEVEELLQSVTPAESLFRVAQGMFKELWDRRVLNAGANARALSARVTEIEQKVEGFLERVLEASVPSVISAYEDRIRKLEEEKLVIRDRIGTASRPANTFEATARTALSFLANPWSLWVSGGLEEKRTVLKLAFVEHLAYARNSGLRTANMSLPFKVLTQLSSPESKMVGPPGLEPGTRPL